MAKTLTEITIYATATDESNGYIQVHATALHAVQSVDIKGSDNTPDNVDSLINLDGPGTLRISVKDGDKIHVQYLY